MVDVDLLYTDVEDSLRATVRDLLGSRCTPQSVLATYDGDRSAATVLWRSVAADLGLAGLLVPEADGGAGASAREAAVVLEELGRSVAPVPFLTSAVVATAALLGAGADPVDPADGSGPARRDLLAALAAGERTAALVVPLSASGFAVTPSVRAEAAGLTGRVTSVAGALDADLLLVPVVTGAGVELHAVEPGAARVEPVVSLDMTRRLADVELADAPSTVVVDASSGEASLRGALRLGAALAASEQVGIAQWCLDTTVGYLKDRRQFGRVVGGFQALKHRLADLYVQVESARAAARYAAGTAADGDPDLEVAASLAQAYCSEVAVRAAEECVQLHGGIGMTWEHPAHLYLKRAKADQIAFGTPGAHRAHLAGLVDLPVA
ncbi:MAG: acyl-CoA dehydrogenase family protein [Nocardioidaceae bacterium]